MAKKLKKIDLTDHSVNPELNLSTAQLKVDLTKDPFKSYSLAYEQQLFTKNFLCRHMGGFPALPITFIDY